MGPCLLCDRPAAHLHHITGRRGPGLGYYDRALVVPLCSPHHVHEHVILRRLGLEWPVTDDTRHRILRVEDLLRRLPDAGRGLVLSPPATRAFGTLWADTAGLLEVAS